MQRAIEPATKSAINSVVYMNYPSAVLSEPRSKELRRGALYAFSQCNTIETAVKAIVNGYTQYSVQTIQ